MKFYFATPYHSWERGTNENTNGLIRQYLPKGSCTRHITQADCDHIANELKYPVFTTDLSGSWLAL